MRFHLCYPQQHNVRGPNDVRPKSTKENHLAVVHFGATDDAASLNEVSTMPEMANAPYLGTWVMKDKEMDSFSNV